MIKITIILVLILLLLITLYSYYCLSSRMIEFERKRLEYILNKEYELKTLDKKIKIISNCTEKNEKYQLAIQNINTIIDKLDLPPGSICQKSNITEQINQEHQINEEHKNNLKILYEVPIHNIETKTESEILSESENL